MMELKLILEFACTACNESVSVTVKCEGKELDQDGRTVARVHVPCPHCAAINRLDFDANGTVRAVTPYAAPRPLPEPEMRGSPLLGCPVVGRRTDSA